MNRKYFTPHQTLFLFLLVSVQVLLLGGCTSLKRAITPSRSIYSHPGYREVVLPYDHGAHPNYKTEWWYWNGHLTAQDGSQYGFQFAFFHLRSLGTWLKGFPVWWLFPSHVSAGQLVVVNKQTGRIAITKRQPVWQWTGTRADKNRMYIKICDWLATGEQDSKGNFIMHLKAPSRHCSLDLELIPLKPAVLHGDKGFLAQGPHFVPSHYISFTRLLAKGSLNLEKKTMEVTGQAWHDHEYMSGAPSAQFAGWDWFSIQFDDDNSVTNMNEANGTEGIHPLRGAEVMLSLIRSLEEEILEGSKGTFVPKNGHPETLTWKEDFFVEAGTEARWKSPATGTVYPLGWRINFPLRKWVIEVSPVSPAQEVSLKFPDLDYWEGACTVAARTPDGIIKGFAYVEMSGYCKSIRDRFHP